MKKRSYPGRQAQLDRIERKLDELLERTPHIVINPASPGAWPVLFPSPGPQNPLYEKAPWWANPDIPPPRVTCSYGNEGGQAE